MCKDKGGADPHRVKSAEQCSYLVFIVNCGGCTGEDSPCLGCHLGFFCDASLNNFTE